MVNIIAIIAPNFVAVILFRLTNITPLISPLTNLLLRPLRTTQIPHALDMDLPHLQPQLARRHNQSLPKLQSSHVHARRAKITIITTTQKNQQPHRFFFIVSSIFFAIC
jgi:hypothetical protein